MYEYFVFEKKFVEKWILQTPLHCAASLGHPECVEILLQYGADKTLKNVRKQSRWNDRE
jgi:hypothetical protein